MARGDWAHALTLLQAQVHPKGLDALSSKDALLLADLHRLRGNHDESISILTHLSNSLEPPVAVPAMLQLAFLHLGREAGSLGEVEALVGKAASLVGEDKRLRGLVAHVQSKLHWKRSEIREAGERLQEARRLLEESGAEDELAKVYDALGMFYEHSGECQRALSFYSLSLSKKAQWRDLYGVGVTLGNLGRFHLKMKEPELALSYLRDDLRIAETVGDLRAQVVVKINIGQALTYADRPEEAQRILEEAVVLAREQGWQEQEAYGLKDLARVVACAGNPDRAFVLLEAALKVFPEGPPAYPRGQVYMTQGELFLELDDGVRKAREAFQKARRIFAAVGAKREEGLVVHALTRVAEKLEEWNTCLYHLEEGMSLLGGGASAIIPFEEILRKIMKSSQDEVLPTAIGPYRIRSRVGAGGFAEVFKGFDAREDASRADVAIKMLRLEGIKDDKERDERKARFRREYEILKGVSHPNVVRLIDFGEEPVPYLVQEFLEGGDLASLTGYNQPVALDKAIAITKEVLCGLSALHEQGIVHRDLKPANVLLRKNGQAVIVDFGLARMLEMAALTLQSAVMGTLAYMAPEQLRGEVVDNRADIYSLGALVFELLSGRLPHEGSSLGEIIRKVEQDKPLDLADLRSTLSPGITRCVMRCLEKDPDCRYPSAEAVLADFEESSRGL